MIPVLSRLPGARRAALLILATAALAGCGHGMGMHRPGMAMGGQGGGGCCGMMGGASGSAQGMACHAPGAGHAHGHGHAHAHEHGAMRPGVAGAAGLPPAQPGGRLMAPAQMAAAGPMCGGEGGGGCCCCGGGMASQPPATGAR